MHAKTTGGVLDTQGLVILVLKSLFCMHKTIGEGWNQYRLFILVLSTLLCVLKSTDEGGDTETSYLGARYAVLHAQNDR